MAANKDLMPISVPAAIIAIAADGAALVFLLSLHVLSPEYSPAWRLVSEYANGRYPWVLSLMFAAYGIGSLALVFAIRSEAASRAGKIGLVLLAVAGIGQVAAAVFNLNMAVLHDLAGALGIICLPIGAVLISVSLVRSPRWAHFRRPVLWAAHLTWIAVLLWAATFGLMVATFMRALGGALPSAPPRVLPADVIAIVGWTDRLLLIAAWAWVALVAYAAIRVNAQAASDRSSQMGPARVSR